MKAESRVKIVKRVALPVLVLVAVLASGPILAVVTGKARLDADWRTGSRESAGIAPSAGTHEEAVVQVYAARALSWRGAFGVHTWISVKERGARDYRVYEVIGWRHYHDLPAVRVSARAPDGRWFGSLPELLADLRGERAAGAIPKIEAAAAAYPFSDEYRVWPGPNSNTFTAHVVRQVPELSVHFPVTAVGKDFLPDAVMSRSPSGTGVQFSLFGLLGIVAARTEGLELNLLGLSLGVAPSPLTLKVPGLGHLRPFSGA